MNKKIIIELDTLKPKTLAKIKDILENQEGAYAYLEDETGNMPFLEWDFKKVFGIKNE